MKKALMVVNPQNDFVLPTGALAVPNGDEIIDVANREINSGMYDLVILIADWHPVDHRSFASNNPGTQVGTIVRLNGRDQMMLPDHCIQGTYGSSFHINLNTTPANLIVRQGTDKNIDSYSAFYDHAGYPTGLGGYLITNQVTDAYILGLATEYCVKWTALDCQKRVGNVQTHLILDGCRGINANDGDVDKALEDMDRCYIELISSLT